MIALDNGDKIQGDTTTASKVDYTIDGVVGTTITQQANGQLPSSIGDLYASSADATVIASIRLVNTNTSAEAVNLYLTPSGGTARRIIPKDLSLGVDYSLVYDGKKIEVYNDSGELLYNVAGLTSADSPQFAGIELGHATDTTLSRVSAGKVGVEGNVITRSNTYFVAANDAPASVKAQADATCDGTDDHTEVLAGLAAGKDVKCSEGTFNFEQSIALDSNQSLTGCGKNTIFTTTTADLDIITATGGSGTEKTGILLADFCVDGDAGEATNDCGIKWTYVDKSAIRNVWSIDNGESGIELYTSDYNQITNCFCNDNATLGIYVYDSNGNVLSNNTCEGNTLSGISVTDSDQDNVIVGNTCQGNSQCGVEVDNSHYSTIEGNTCSDNGWNGVALHTTSSYNSVTGNVSNGSVSYYGIGIDTDCNSNSVTGNICKGNNLSGITVNGADNNVVIGNVARLNNQHGITLTSSDNNLISGNHLTENSQGTTNTYDDIFLSISDYNQIQGNLCRAGGETNKPRYGINVSTDTCDGNKVINNDLYDDGFATGAYNDSGTGTVYVEPGIDDTPVNGETGQPISSNWAYDHKADPDAHGDAVITCDTDSATADDKNFSIVGGEGIDTSGATSIVTVKGEDATDSNKGIASFSSSDFLPIAINAIS